MLGEHEEEGEEVAVEGREVEVEWLDREVAPSDEDDDGQDELADVVLVLAAFNFGDVLNGDANNEGPLPITSLGTRLLAAGTCCCCCCWCWWWCGVVVEMVGPLATRARPVEGRANSEDAEE